MLGAPGAGGGPEPPGRVPAAGPGELGGASLVALALTAFLLLAGLLAVDVGALVAARAAAQTAADMAALAALTPSDGTAAARAAAIASANGTELVVCDCSAVEAVVSVRRRVALAPTGLSVWVTARARAVLAARPSAPAARGPARAASGQRVGWREPGGGPSSSARPSPATQALLAATLVAAPVGSSRRASGRTSEPGCRARHHRDRRRGSASPARAPEGDPDGAGSAQAGVSGAGPLARWVGATATRCGRRSARCACWSAAAVPRDTRRPGARSGPSARRGPSARPARRGRARPAGGRSRAAARRRGSRRRGEPTAAPAVGSAWTWTSRRRGTGTRRAGTPARRTRP